MCAIGLPKALYADISEALDRVDYDLLLSNLDDLTDHYVPLVIHQTHEKSMTSVPQLIYSLRPHQNNAHHPAGQL